MAVHGRLQCTGYCELAFLQGGGLAEIRVADILVSALLIQFIDWVVQYV